MKKRREANHQSKYQPYDTQYQRLVQNISETIKRTEMSPISPKNKLMGKVQVFGSSG